MRNEDSFQCLRMAFRAGAAAFFAEAFAAFFAGAFATFFAGGR